MKKKKESNSDYDIVALQSIRAADVRNYTVPITRHTFGAKHLELIKQTLHLVVDFL